MGVGIECVVVEHASNGFVEVLCESFFYSDQNLQKSTNTYLGVGTEGSVVEDTSSDFIGVLC